MTAADLMLCLAGAIGMTVAIIHTIVMRRVIIRPIAPTVASQPDMRAGAKRLVAPLLYASGLSWFVEGAALVAAAICIPGVGRLIPCAVALTSYSYAAAMNAWATRGRHFGWVLMAVAAALIATTMVPLLMTDVRPLAGDR